MKRASNPVAPTTLLQGYRKKRTASPVAEPVAGADAWQAFASAAASLAAAANAIAGKGFSFPFPAAAPALPADALTVAELVNEFLLAKARAGRSDRYLRALRNSLTKFVLGRARLPITSVSLGDVERWMERPEWAARTRKGYLSDVRTLFNFAVRRGYLARSPAAGVESPVVEDSPVAIHSPQEVRLSLELARRHDLDLCRCLAVRYFAGLRSSEAVRLAESEIRLDAGIIEVTAAKAKTRRRRLVMIQPNLRAWLELGGALPLTCVSNRLRAFARVLRQAGVESPHNVTRHSFCSYHLAQFGSASKTALEAGHSEAMLFAHYREVVSPAEAAAFWQIRPPG